MNLDIKSNSKTWYSRSWQFETNSIQIQLQDLALQALAIEFVSIPGKRIKLKGLLQIQVQFIFSDSFVRVHQE